MLLTFEGYICGILTTNYVHLCIDMDLNFIVYRNIICYNISETKIWFSFINVKKAKKKKKKKKK